MLKSFGPYYPKSFEKSKNKTKKSAETYSGVNMCGSTTWWGRSPMRQSAHRLRFGFVRVCFGFVLGLFWPAKHLSFNALVYTIKELTAIGRDDKLGSFCKKPVFIKPLPPDCIDTLGTLHRVTSAARCGSGF
jgi:hypothetical protein